MRSALPLPLLMMVLLIAAFAGGGVLAQMESGDRGILPVDSSGTLEIGGIHVDVGAKDANTARLAGWRIAQREGFARLWAKTHRLPQSQAPKLSDSVLDSLVSSIIVEREQIGPGRYIADLGVLFDRSRAGELLGVAGITRRSAPMLLIPVMVSAGTMTSLEIRNPWQRAWAQFRTSNSPIDYVRLSGLGIDPLLVNAALTRRPGRGWWRNVIDLYGAADILIAEVQVQRFYPGGPATARFIARHGPDGEILGGFALRSRGPAGIPAMMAQGVERIDAIFAQALAANRLERDPTLITYVPPPVEEEELIEEPQQQLVLERPRTYQIRIETPNGGVLPAAAAQVRGVGGVVGVTEQHVAIGGTSSLLVIYRGDIGGLVAALNARGLAAEATGGYILIRRLAPAAPPPVVPPPAPPGGAPPGPPQPPQDPTPPEPGPRVVF